MSRRINSEKPIVLLIAILISGVAPWAFGDSYKLTPVSATASASLNQANSASKAIDGNVTTTWNSGALAPQWIDINLGSTGVTVESLRLQPALSPTPGTATHQIQVARVANPAASDYTTVVTLSQSFTNWQWVTVTLPVPQDDVYHVRILTTGGASWVAWYEVQVWGQLANVACSYSIYGNYLSIDLGTTLGPVSYRASGFINLLSTQADGDVLSPLKPKLWRSDSWVLDRDPWDLSRLSSLGSRIQALPMTYYGNHGGHYPQTIAEADSPEWTQSIIADVASHGATIEWDLMNEPDLHYDLNRASATYSGDVFFQAWRRAFEAVKTARGNTPTTIVGPSFARFNATYLKDFLAFASANAVLPTRLSWHELTVSEGLPSGIGPHVGILRSWMSSTLGVQLPIDINEYVPYSRDDSPGTIVHYLSALESAGVAGAHACWGSQGAHCWDYTINGLLDGAHQKTSKWYVYKHYGDMSGQIVKSRVYGTGQIAGLASWDGTTLRILFGWDGPPPYTTPGAGAMIYIQGIPNPAWRTATVTAEYLPYSGRCGISTRCVTSTMPVCNGEVVITLPSSQIWDAYYYSITFSP